MAVLPNLDVIVETYLTFTEYLLCYAEIVDTSHLCPSLHFHSENVPSVLGFMDYLL